MRKYLFLKNSIIIFVGRITVVYCMYIAWYGSESEKGNCRQGIGCKLCGMRRTADTQVEHFF